ncbi:unnamed protein product, partial [marine sediment metagenome]
FDKNELEVLHLKNAGEIGSLELAMNILINQNFSEIVYLAEDDYFYLPNQFEKMVKLLKSDSEVDFITPYDHLDYYTYPFHKFQSKIKFFAGKHWRTVVSTCNTYLTSKKTLIKTNGIFLRSYSSQKMFTNIILKLKKENFLKQIFRDFLPRSLDADVWLSLTKMKIYNLFIILKYRYHYPKVYGIYFRTWRYNWKQVLFGKKWNLWCPIPSIATHMVKTCLAPGIDLTYFFSNPKEKIADYPNRSAIIFGIETIDGYFIYYMRIRRRTLIVEI